MDITKLIRDGLLKVEQLEPQNTYVFTLGNEDIQPSVEDLTALKGLISELTQENYEKFPAIFVTPYAHIEEVESRPSEFMFREIINRLENVE